MSASPRTETPEGGADVRERALLEVTDLDAGYGMSRVLFGVRLRVRRGEVVALLGRNGAGKTTTLKAIMGILRPTAGRVLFDGRDVSRLPSHLIARSGIGYVPQDRRIFPDLTVRENLEVGRQAGRGGAVEAIICLKAMQDSMIPPTIITRRPTRHAILTMCRTSSARKRSTSRCRIQSDSAGTIPA